MLGSVFYSTYYYKSLYECLNCKETIEKNIKKGELRPMYVTCTNCGCNTSGRKV